MSDPHVHYYVGGRLVLVDVGHAPRVNDEVGIEDRVYAVVRVVWHRPLCPPDRVNVHLQLRPAEEVCITP